MKIDDEMYNLWPAVEREGETPEGVAIRTRDEESTLKLFRKAIRQHGRADVNATGRQRSCGGAPEGLSPKGSLCCDVR